MTVSAARRGAAQQQVLRRPIEPPATALHNLKLLQVWQWGNTTLEDAFALCHRTGLTGLLVKALDGPSWMSQFDDSYNALGSVTEVRAQAFAAHVNGLYHFAWTNPLQNNLAEQAGLTAAIAEACDGVFLDVEPYAQFWGPNAPMGRAAGFMESIRAQAPDAFIALQPDPRPGALASIRVSEWLPYCDALSGQYYWSDFLTDPSAELVKAVAHGLLYQIPILPTLPGNAGGWPPAEMIERLPGFVVWRMGSTPAGRLGWLGGLSVAGLESAKIPAL